jgi:hypothetical protein
VWVGGPAKILPHIWQSLFCSHKKDEGFSVWGCVRWCVFFGGVVCHSKWPLTQYTVSNHIDPTYQTFVWLFNPTDQVQMFFIHNDLLR